MPLDLEVIRTALPEREIVWLETCESTMTEAAKLVHAGAPSGTAVVAEQQTAGQGRYRRNWHSEPECGLYVSVILRLGIPEDRARVVTMALGLAAAEAIARATGIRCDLRWPNDVLIGEKKCVGILVQLESMPNPVPHTPPALVAGIGINVNHEAFPPELAGIATSLRIASGAPQSRERLLVHLLEAVDSFTRMLGEGGKEPVFAMFTRASSYVRGKHVIVEQGDNQVEGITDGLDPAGFLYVRRPDGTRTTILAGGVRPARLTSEEGPRCS